MTDGRLIEVTGPERVAFLQGLVTNDLGKLADGLVYTALLTPQGKFIVDFFVVPRPDAIWLDVAPDHRADLLKRLTMYKLRRNVQLAPLDGAVSRGLPPAPEGALADPRHPALGWRGYDGQAAQVVDWDAIRVANGIPETGIELTPDTFILEAGFERLNGVDFRKGCFVGQEVTARMKHKAELRKGIVAVAIDGAAPVGTPILTEDDKEAGTVYTQSGGRALAHVRFDRMQGGLRAGTARITP